MVHKTYRIVGVMPPRFRWREAEITCLSKSRSIGISIWVKLLMLRPEHPWVRERRMQPLFEQFAKQTAARYPTVSRRTAQH